MAQFFQQIVNGLSLGAIYALIAVGYTMVYGVLQLINFAHGDVFMVGAMLVLVLATFFGFVGGADATQYPVLAFTLCALISIMACGTLGYSIERLAYRPLRDKPRINSLITAIGISLLLEFGGQHPKVFGATPQSYTPVSGMLPVLDNSIRVAGVVISSIDATVIVVALALMAALTYIVLYTRIGLALRAVSYRFDTASLMGVDINKVVSFTFVLGSVLAAIAGILYALKYPRVEPLMGLLPGIKAFVAAVFGGIGNIGGAVLGAMIIGLTEVMIVGYLPNGSQYKDAVAFVILIVILMVKPTGLLGRNVAEKV